MIPADVEVEPYRLPLLSPLRFARSEIVAREGFFVRFLDREGNRGEGDAAPLPEIGTETLRETEAALAKATKLARIVSSPRTLDELSETLAPFEGTPAARAGLAQASISLGNARDSRRADALFGVAKRRLVPVNGLIGLGSAEAGAETAREIVGRGIRVIKIKLGASAEEDAARIDAIRGVAPEVELRLDANGLWTRDEAIERLSRLDARRVEYVEQPVSNPDDFPAIKAATGFRCAADESMKSFAEATRIIEARLADAAILKPTLVGGVDRAAALIRLCEQNGVAPVVTHAFESPLGYRAAVFAAAQISDPTLAAGLDYENVFPRETFDTNATVENGRIDARNFLF